MILQLLVSWIQLFLRLRGPIYSLLCVSPVFLFLFYTVHKNLTMLDALYYNLHSVLVLCRVQFCDPSITSNIYSARCLTFPKRSHLKHRNGLKLKDQTEHKILPVFTELDKLTDLKYVLSMYLFLSLKFFVMTVTFYFSSFNYTLFCQILHYFFFNNMYTIWFRNHSTKSELYLNLQRKGTLENVIFFYLFVLCISTRCSPGKAWIDLWIKNADISSKLHFCRLTTINVSLPLHDFLHRRYHFLHIESKLFHMISARYP